MRKSFFVLLTTAMLLGGEKGFAQELSFDAIAEREGRDLGIASITKVAITPASTAVRLEWETREPAVSYLEYGETPAYGLRAPMADTKSPASQSHRAELAGLSEFRTYHFRIRSMNTGSANETFSRPLTFTTLPSGGFAESPLVPTPLDFTAPHVQSFLLGQKEGLSAVDIITDEQSSSRIEYGVYVKGAPFLFEDKESTATRADRAHFVLRTITPGSVYLYRLSTQDRYGNRALLYGTFQTEPITRHFEQREESRAVSGQRDPSSSSRDDVNNKAPANSVLIVTPSQLVGIPKADIWKDEKSGRLYRIFRTAPTGSVLLTSPSQLAGLNVFQIWKDEKSGRLYRHAGIPNPGGKELSKNKEEVKSKESSKNKETQQNKETRLSVIPKQWIRITHPLQLKVLFKNEVWRDAKSGAMYRIVGPNKTPTVFEERGAQAPKSE